MLSTKLNDVCRGHDWEIDAADMEDPNVIIGRGNSGTVYKVRIGGVIYACKKLFVDKGGEEEVSRFLLKEAKSLAQLRHPNIIQLFGICLSEKSLVMEYADQGTVRDELKEAIKEPSSLQNILPLEKNGPDELGQLAGWRKFEILHHVALAMQAVHQKGAVHQDIKPSNCMVVQGGTVKLGDFGLASGLATTVGVTGRTTAYAAPELLRGRKAKPAVDIYAFGMMVVTGMMVPSVCSLYFPNPLRPMK